MTIGFRNYHKPIKEDVICFEVGTLNSALHIAAGLQVDFAVDKGGRGQDLLCCHQRFVSLYCYVCI